VGVPAQHARHEEFFNLFLANLMQAGINLASQFKAFFNKKYTKLLPWLIPLATVCVMSFFVMPRRAVGLSSDDGLFLTLSWQVANGFGLDRLALPQSPNYLFNAIFMRIGFHEIYWFRFFNVVLSAISSFALFSALRKKRIPAYVTPIAVAACAGISLYTIQGPNSLAMNFFMLGLAAFFSGNKVSDRKQSVLHVISGILLATAGFMHVVVAVGIVAWLLFAMVLGYRSRLVLLIHILVSALLWTWYINAVGPSIFFAAPKAHSGDAFHLLGRLLLIIRYYGEISLFSVCCFLALRYFTKLKKYTPYLCSLLAIFFLYHLCVYTFRTIYLNEPIQLGRAFPLHGVFLLSEDGLWISALPGAFAFHILVASFFYYCFSSKGSWILKKPQMPPADTIDNPRLDPDLIVTTAGIVTLQMATGIGSNTGISQGMIFLAGPACGLALVFMSGSSLEKNPARRWAHKIFCTLCLTVITLFSLFYDHTENQHIFSSELKPISAPPMRGLLAPPDYSSAMDKLIDSYQKNECASKRMIALDYVPLFNYVVGHPFDKTVGLVRPLFYFSNEEILSELRNGDQWCVLDITSIETRANIDRNKSDPRSDVRTWLERNSSASEKIDATGLVDLSDITMFVIK
jgi:hypothetical protein